MGSVYHRVYGATGPLGIKPYVGESASQCIGYAFLGWAVTSLYHDIERVLLTWQGFIQDSILISENPLKVPEQDSKTSKVLIWRSASRFLRYLAFFLRYFIWFLGLILSFTTQYLKSVRIICKGRKNGRHLCTGLQHE